MHVAPYGVRAGAKKIGTEHPCGQVPVDIKGIKAPKTVDYELAELVVDLLEFSAKFLRIGGRLVYWLPVINDDFSDEAIPKHPALRLIADSSQCFGKWSRRLITMERVQYDETAEAEADMILNKFKSKYFNRE